MKKNYIRNFDDKQKLFLNRGYYIFDITEKKLINRIKNQIKKKVSNEFKIKKNLDLNLFHKYCDVSDLNKARLNLINFINKENQFEKDYFNICKNELFKIIGNEIAIQNEISLSIQLPKDKSSLLPMHADTWSGNSPFEIVVWIPLVDCYKTKSMFILDKNYLSKFNQEFRKPKMSSDKIFKKYKKYFKFINIKYGQGLIFDQNIPHGNIVNTTKETRWSFNCRFKSLFSPYKEKKFGDTFKVMTIKPATLIGLNYKFPRTK